MKQYFTILLFILISFSGNLFGQLFYSENFDNGLDGWTSYDLDGDNQTWQTYDFSAVLPNFGSGTLISYSSDLAGNKFNPDQLIVSPEIDLTNVTAESIIFRIVGIGDYTVNDHYAIYVTTSDNLDDILQTTPIIDEDTKADFIHKIDFSEYIGKKIFISFRHFKSKDKFYVGFDNLEIKNPIESYAEIQSMIYPTYLDKNQEEKLYVITKNLGSDTIKSVKINWQSGDQSYSNVFEVNIPPYGLAYSEHPDKLKFDKVDKNNVVVTIEEVNGVVNNNQVSHSKDFDVWTISKSGNKVVFVEESTGTWCGYCPRGIVALEKLDEEADDYVAAVAVHIYDTLQNKNYGPKAKFSGAPFMNIDRNLKNINLDLGTLIPLMEEFTSEPCAADMEMTGELNNRNLKLDLNNTFYTKYDKGDLRYSVVLYENGVTGEGAAFAQANYFSGQDVELEGYEDKPNPIPAEDMVYNHVGRVLLGGYDGQEGSVPQAISDNGSANYTFNYTFPEDDKIENFVAIGIVLDANGQVINSRKIKLATLTSTEDQLVSFDSFDVFPNPTTDFVVIKNIEKGDYIIQVVDVTGKIHKSNAIKISSKNEEFRLNLNSLVSGNYLISVSNDTYSMNKMITIK